MDFETNTQAPPWLQCGVASDSICCPTQTSILSLGPINFIYQASNSGCNRNPSASLTLWHDYHSSFPVDPIHTISTWTQVQLLLTFWSFPCSQINSFLVDFDWMCKSQFSLSQQSRVLRRLWSSRGLLRWHLPVPAPWSLPEEMLKLHLSLSFTIGWWYFKTL
jgi:hypothetical protein